MAIATICSSPNPTISLPSLPTFPSSSKTHHSLQPTSSSSSNFGEAIALAGAAMEAANNAASVASGIGRVDDNGGVRDGSVGIEVRRKRRRKRRKGLGFLDEEEYQRNFSEQRILGGPVKTWCLSSKAEAELCLCLKEGTRIEDAMLRITDSEENFAISSRKNPLGLRDRNLDKVLCNTRESRERIARAYQGLVASIAADYQGKGLSLQDLMQGSKYEMISKVAEANNALRNRLRRSPTYEETAELLDVNASTVRLVSENSRAPISLGSTLTDQGHMTLQNWNEILMVVMETMQEIMAGPDELVPEKMLERKVVKEGVEKLLETLNKREAETVRLYYGLTGQTPLSFEETGRMLKLSRERVRQIHGVALSKLKHSPIINTLQYFAEY